MHTHPLSDTAIEWRILGQERDGSLLASWVSLPSAHNGHAADDADADNVRPTTTSLDGRTNIGLYMAAQKSFSLLHTFSGRENVIQASVNASQTLLAFVLKEVPSPSPDTSSPIDSAAATMVYKPFVVEVNNAAAGDPHPLLQMARTKQVMVQFLWRKQTTFEKLYQDKFLVFIHEECEF